MIRNWLNEFREFILKGNAFDLAVGLVIGAAFTALVNSMVDDLFMAPLGFVLGGLDFSNYFADLTSFFGYGQEQSSVEAAQRAGHAVIAYGKFITAVIKLLIIGFVVFLLVKQINRFRRVEPPKQEMPADVKLLTEIRDLLAAQNR